jgi:hypothetical protein
MMKKFAKYLANLMTIRQIMRNVKRKHSIIVQNVKKISLKIIEIFKYCSNKLF